MRAVNMGLPCFNLVELYMRIILILACSKEHTDSCVFSVHLVSLWTLLSRGCNDLEERLIFFNTFYGKEYCRGSRWKTKIIQFMILRIFLSVLLLKCSVQFHHVSPSYFWRELRLSMRKIFGVQDILKKGFLVKLFWKGTNENGWIAKLCIGVSSYIYIYIFVFCVFIC